MFLALSESARLIRASARLGSHRPSLKTGAVEDALFRGDTVAGTVIPNFKYDAEVFLIQPTLRSLQEHTT